MLMFASVALAQEEDSGQRAAQTAGGGVDLGQPVSASGFDDGQTGGATASATMTASASASASASPSASATALPNSGGINIAALSLMAGLLFLGSGVLSYAILRRK
jgi:hypothetical protein